MSEDFTDPDIAEITVRFLGLTVSITGPADQASSLVSSLARHHTDHLAAQSSHSAASSPISASTAVEVPVHSVPRPSSVASNTSYSWVPSAAESSATTSRRRETRDQIEASFEPCPDRYLLWSSEVRGGNLSGERRIRRAWKAGCWARAVLDQRVATPNRTEPLDVRPRYYVVVRASSVQRPCVFASSVGYWRTIGTLRGSSSISHSFPTEAESRTYCAGAGIDFPEVQP